MKTNDLSRRSFIENIAGAGLALSVTRSPLSTIFNSENYESDREIMVFSKQLEWIKDPKQLCELVAKAGFDGLELTVRPGGYVLPERVEEDLPRVAEAAKEAGIKIKMISTRINNPGDPVAERTLKTANSLGIKLYRTGSLSYDQSKSIEQNLNEFKAIFKDLAQLNKEYRIHGAYQNHAGNNRVSASIWDLWLLLKDLNPEWIGCQYDTRHSQLEGGSWWPIGLKLMHPYIKTTIVKDYKWIQVENQRKVQNCPIGEGQVDFESYFKLVKEHNISGPISLHFPYPFIENADKISKRERMEKTVTFMRKKGVVQLKNMLKQAGIN